MDSISKHDETKNIYAVMQTVESCDSSDSIVTRLRAR